MILLPVLAFVVISGFAYAATFLEFSITPVELSSAIASTPSSDDMNLQGMICATFKHADGSVYQQDCHHNLQTTQGKTIVRDALRSAMGAQTPINLTWISVANGTAPVVGDTSLNGEQTTCGFSRTAGTVIITTGNTSAFVIQATYTNTCAVNYIYINTSGLHNSSSGNWLAFGGNFAGANMTQNDQLTVNYTINN